MPQGEVEATILGLSVATAWTLHQLSIYPEAFLTTAHNGSPPCPPSFFILLQEAITTWLPLCSPSLLVPWLSLLLERTLHEGQTSSVAQCCCPGCRLSGDAQYDLVTGLMSGQERPPAGPCGSPNLFFSRSCLWSGLCLLGMGNQGRAFPSLLSPHACLYLVFGSSHTLPLRGSGYFMERQEIVKCTPKQER